MSGSNWPTNSDDFLISRLFLLCPSAYSQRYQGDGREYVEEVVAPEVYLENSSFKLVRGVANAITCPGEFPKQIVVTIRDRGPMGIVLGPLKGLGMMGLRGVSGIWEIATFPLPNTLDGDFSAILKPEFVWTPSAKIQH
ncbi:MAG: hypothetical protein B6I37_06995 [Desulfobacteraceae bacterium 4572_35.2]|nr:MAG: hypothetical protein B6I37_06995 [Desulfobacteraceae bacterium 4572_35.2]